MREILSLPNAGKPAEPSRLSCASEDRLQILVVIVLYKTLPQHAASFRGLQTAIAAGGEQQRCLRILLYDNAPVGVPPQGLAADVVYHAAARNEGVAGAYNFALHLAQQQDCGWILTLDQDTQLPADYLEKLLAIARRLHHVSEIAAIVPHLVQGNRPLSPVRIRSWGVDYLSPATTGLVEGEIHAFNSGSLLRRSALQQIGGFDKRFWLDYQDASLYRRLHQYGKRIYIAEGLNLEHHLSLLSDQHSMDADRYQNYLWAESAYCDMYREWIARLFLTGRLGGRIWRQWKSGKDPAILRLTRKMLQCRLFQSRKRRLAEWNSARQAQWQNGGADADVVAESERRPRVSVCMAAYNGERYITPQLQSILAQLAPDDEVIVVDDASRDGTREMVLALNDSRIRLIEHHSNQGVSRTFEDAIRAASGNILFLSDQDDIWDPRKVTIILEAFRTRAEITLIATDNALIDADGSLIAASYFTGRGKFSSGLWANLVRNRFGGCTMALRAEVTGDFLPLPHNFDVLHDVWIGVVNSLTGHQALYIPESLVLNRRHATTATGRQKLTFRRRIRIRIHLLLALAEFQRRRLMF